MHGVYVSQLLSLKTTCVACVVPFNNFVIRPDQCQGSYRCLRKKFQEFSRIFQEYFIYFPGVFRRHFSRALCALRNFYCPYIDFSLCDIL